MTEETIQPQPMQADTIEALTNLTGLLLMIEHTLRGEIRVVEQDKTGVYIERWEKLGAPWAEDLAIKKIVSHLIAFLNSNFSLSDFDLERLDKTILNLKLDFTVWLGINHRLLGIEPRDINQICDIVEYNIEANLNKSKEGRVFDGITKTILERRLIQTAMAPQKKGILSAIFNRKQEGEDYGSR